MVKTNQDIRTLVTINAKQEQSKGDTIVKKQDSRLMRERTTIKVHFEKMAVSLGSLISQMMWPHLDHSTLTISGLGTHQVSYATTEP